jgi:DNA-binding beta-propeller fold protein YncE
VTFDPTKPGLRQDALIVKDGNGQVVEEVFLHGIGVGAVPVFSPAAATLQFCGGTTCPYLIAGYQGIAAEANGKILVLNGAPSAICEFDPKTGNCPNISTVAGPSNAGLAVDAAGNIFYGHEDYSNQSTGIHRIDAFTGTDSLVISSGSVSEVFVAPTGTIYYVSGD